MSDGRVASIELPFDDRLDGTGDIEGDDMPDSCVARPRSAVGPNASREPRPPRAMIVNMMKKMAVRLWPRRIGAARRRVRRGRKQLWLMDQQESRIMRRSIVERPADGRVRRLHEVPAVAEPAG